jgi:hypothetical protein
MTYRTSRAEVRALRSDRERIAKLIGRYPGLSDDEAGEVLAFLRSARHLDVGLLTSNEGLRPKLDAFMDDHKAHFRASLVESSAVIAVIAAMLFALWLGREAFG